MLLAMALAGCNGDGGANAGGNEAGSGGDDLGAPAGDLLTDPPMDLADCPGSSDLADVPLGSMALEGPTPIGDGPVLLATADLDGDGHVDLIESRAYKSGGNEAGLEVRFGLGGLRFTAPVTAWTTPSDYPVVAVVADFDGDHRLDLLASSSLGSKQMRLGLIRGTGPRTFGKPVEVPLPHGTGTLATGDFDGDGRSEAVVACPNARSAPLGLLRLDGMGVPSLTDAVPFDKNGSAGTVYAADLDGDKRLDLLADLSGYYDGQKTRHYGLLVARGHGDGTFEPPTPFETSEYRTLAARGDFNGDGKLDVVTYEGGGGLALLFGNGDGTFASPTPIDSGDFSYGPLSAADWNHDGHLDLALEDDDHTDLRLLLGRGDGTFDPPRGFVTGDLSAAIYRRSWMLNAVAAADLDEDGALDVALAGRAGTLVLHGNGDGSLRSGRSFRGGRGPGLVVADFDHDGRSDFATTDWGDYAVISLATAKPEKRSAQRVVAGASPRTLVTGDFNGDGHPDLVVGEQGNPGIAFLAGHGDGTFAAPVHLPTTCAPFALATGDFDGDRRLDVAAACLESSRAFVLPGQGDGRFGTEVSVAVDAAISLAAADVDGDGALDLVVGSRYSASEDGGAFLVRGDGHGALAAPVQIFSTPHPVRHLAVGDVDGDGRLDVVAALFSGEAAVLLGTCHGTFRQLPSLAVPTTRAGFYPSSVTLADLDGNGLPEMVLTVPGTDPPFLRCFERCDSPGLVLFPNLGHGHFAAPLPVGAGWLADAVAATDLDGDGRRDLVVMNSGGTFSLIRNLAH